MAPEKKASKIGNVGGPALGAATRMLGRVARGPFRAGEQAARDMTERNRGWAADRANRSGSLLGRMVFSLMANQWRPGRHPTAARIKRGHDHRTSLNEQTASILRARAERVSGVAARKAAYVEAARNGGRDAEQAIILLLNEQSWQEVQNSVMRRGRNRGKRVTEIRAWQDVLTDNPQLWAQVAEKRPDLTPDVLQGAEEEVGVTYESLTGHDRLALDDLSLEALSTAISRLRVGELARLHEGFFSEIGRLADPNLSTELYNHLHTIISSTGDVGLSAKGSFAGGPRQDALDAALAPAGQSYHTL